MAYKHLLVEQTQHVTTLTLNRPDKMNALNLALLSELTLAFEQLHHAPECRAIMLTGADSAFCAGADLQDMPEVVEGQTANLGAILERYYNPLITLMRSHKKPIIVAINGPAVGAGLSLALGGDILVAGASATFMLAFSRIGLIPDMGSTWLLPRLIGRQRTLSLALLPEPFPAEQALAWGLLHAVYPDDILKTRAMAMAQALSTGPSTTYSLIKQALNGAEERTFTDQLALEVTLQRQAGHTNDFQEGIKAFSEKRAPQYSGT